MEGQDEKALAPDVTDARYARLEAEGRRAVHGWLGHPEVKRQVGLAKDPVNVIVAPLGLWDQAMVTLVTARFLDTAALWPDGSVWPNPFIGQDDALLEQAARIGPVLVAELQALAERLAISGVPLDPRDPGVLLVLAQLTLLEVDLTQPAAEIIDDLNTLPPGWIVRDAAMRGHVETGVSRHGRRVRFKADLSAVGEQLTGRLGPTAIAAPYASGHRRQTAAPTARLREVLAQLAEKDPSLTPGRLLEAVKGEEHPALDQLRNLLGWGDAYLPDRRTLERNWPKSRH